MGQQPPAVRTERQSSIGRAVQREGESTGRSGDIQGRLLDASGYTSCPGVPEILLYPPCPSSSWLKLSLFEWVSATFHKSNLTEMRHCEILFSLSGLSFQKVCRF